MAAAGVRLQAHDARTAIALSARSRLRPCRLRSLRTPRGVAVAAARGEGEIPPTDSGRPTLAQTLAGPAPPTASRAAAPVPAFHSAVAHPGYMAAGFALYSMAAIDVFHPSSLHLLQPLDEGIHHLALSIDPAVRKAVFGGVVSNGFIQLAGVGWIVVTATAMSRMNPLGWAACGLGWALWLFGAGPIQHDPLVMEVTKAAFGRARPSPIHRTASFPSGHTAAVVLLVGGLLFVLLPAIYGSVKHRGEQEQEQQAGPQAGQQGRHGGEQPGGQAQVQGGPAAAAGAGEASGQAALHPIMEAIHSVQNSWALWGVATATTITGRVLVDAHWLSDTIAGAGLSLAMVSGMAIATDRIATSGVLPAGLWGAGLGAGAAGWGRAGGPKQAAEAAGAALGIGRVAAAVEATPLAAAAADKDGDAGAVAPGDGVEQAAGGVRGGVVLVDGRTGTEL